MEKIKTNPEEFKRFHGLLTSSHKEYDPFYFKLSRGNKDPAVSGSWKKSKLSFEEAFREMKNGYNIGIAATDTDRLVIVDIDNMEAVKNPKKTLTNVSRKRIGRHCFYFSDDKPVKGVEALNTESAKQNIATEDAGEVRANWQYVVCAGSYVPCNKEETDKIPEYDKENAGKYEVYEEREVSEITYKELPEIYKSVRDNKRKIWEKNEERKKEDRKNDNVKDGRKNKSGLWDLDIYDVSGLSDTKGARIQMPSEIHGSETGKNCSVKDGLLTCWRHNVSHNGQTI